jgi:MraZ protein
VGDKFHLSADVGESGWSNFCQFSLLIDFAMSFFKGQETYSIDDKGRVNVPTKMRKSIQPEAGDTFILTRGVDKCIVAYPMNEWKVYEEKFAKLNQYSEKDRFFLRMILSWSEEVEMDAQQRVSVPKRLRELNQKLRLSA